jgi:hypothetical protein
MLTTLLLGLAMTAGAGADLIVDDFTEPGISGLGTPWQGFTDRVMGGRSTIEAGYLERDGRTVLAMRGEVSLENNGGFVQVRLPLAPRGTYNASEYEGIAVEVRGRPGSYFVHLRSASSRRPWQYHAAPLPVASEWERIVIPFSAFESEGTRRDLDVQSLVSLAVVAGEVEFYADVEIREISLVRSVQP